MKKILLQFIALLFIGVSAVESQNITKNGIVYQIISDSTAACYGYAPNDSISFNNVSIRSSIEIEDGEEKNIYTVKRVNPMAFYCCQELVSVTIPASVEVIGDYAFSGCKNLKKAWLSIGLETIGNSAFKDTGIESFSMPSSVKNLGTGIFYDCKNLEYAELGMGHTTVTHSMFRGCEKLKSIFFPSNILTIEGYAFFGCISIDKFLLSSTVLNLEPSAFTGCAGEFVALSNGPTGLYVFNTPNIFYGNKFKSLLLTQNEWIFADRSFANSSELEEIRIGGFVKVIPEGCFYDCPKLETIDIAAGIEVIRAGAFQYCRKIREFVAPETLNFIGAYAFSSCDSLRKIILNDGLKTIGVNAFAGCRKVEKIVIPSSVSTIGIYAFDNCTGILEMNCELTDSVARWNHIFNGNGFTEVKIGEGVKHVGKNLFYNSYKLKSISLPKSLTSIGEFAFDNCGNVETVYANSMIPPTADYNPFSNSIYTKATLFVPKGAAAAYRSAPYWKNFTNIIEMGPSVAGDINGDDKVNVGDVTTIVSMILDSSLQSDSADVNDDGVVNVGDVTTLVSIILGE